MINEQLLHPESIVVIGASNDTGKPGGKMLKNIIDGGYKGKLTAVNPNEKKVQGIPSVASIEDLNDTALAILAIPAEHCLEAVRTLIEKKNTKAFIIISAGFSEAGKKGAALEKKMAALVTKRNGCLIGPNCIGVITEHYKGVFTTPIPKFNPKGCDLISGSGATAVFLMEAGIGLGIGFANVFSTGNGIQTSVEDVLEYMDLHFDPATSPPIKLLYLETISDPGKLLKHAASLTKKGARIAAIKAGSTKEGSRAASSHTGAIATNDITIRALFKKAGIVYCSSREELLSVASIFNYKKLKGKNIAIITHAGGSAVMLADVLSKGGLKVPEIKGRAAKKLKTFLHPGSSVGNPIDFLATGTAEQLGIIIDHCEHAFKEIDAMVVVFGSPGLFDVENVYQLLSQKMEECKKPIFPVLPSVINAQKEIRSFVGKGHINFPDEVVLGSALAQVYNTPPPAATQIKRPVLDRNKIRSIIGKASNGYLNSENTSQLMDAAGIPRVAEVVIKTKEEVPSSIRKISFPLVMKVIGPLHKSDVNGVILNITSSEEAIAAFEKAMQIENATGVIIQPQLIGLELFVGATRETGFHPTILFGLGGIFIEIMNAISAGMAPVSAKEAQDMVRSLKGYQLIRGTRGKPGVNEAHFIEIIRRVSALMEVAPEILEMDINPLIGTPTEITAVDVRIRVKRKD